MWPVDVPFFDIESSVAIRPVDIFCVQVEASRALFDLAPDKPLGDLHAGVGERGQRLGAPQSGLPFSASRQSGPPELSRLRGCSDRNVVDGAPVQTIHCREATSGQEQKTLYLGAIG